MSHRTGLLMIRTWIEDGSAEPLRARVQISNDISAGIEQTLTLSQPQAVVELVESWLKSTLAEQETAPSPPATVLPFDRS